MEPLDSLRSIRQELENLSSEVLSRGMDAAPGLQEKLDQLHAELLATEARLGAATARLPNPADLRADLQKRIDEKLRRVNEIKALKEKHGARWVFVPTAAEQAAAAVAPIEPGEVPGMVRSMFQQLDIHPSRPGQRGDATVDHEIWEDLSQSDQGSSGSSDRSDSLAPRPIRHQPKKPGEEVWEDLSQLDNG